MSEIQGLVNPSHSIRRLSEQLNQTCDYCPRPARFETLRRFTEEGKAEEQRELVCDFHVKEFARNHQVSIP